MFENAGSKIRIYAEAFFAVEAVAAVIGGIVLMINEMFLPGLIVALVGILVAYVTALFLAAFGELVESSVENRRINGEILDLMKKKNGVASAPAPVKPQVDYTEYYGVTAPKTVKPTSGTWICTGCNTQNSTNYSMCKKCGQYRRG